MASILDFLKRRGKRLTLNFSRFLLFLKGERGRVKLKKFKIILKSNNFKFLPSPAPPLKNNKNLEKCKVSIFPCFKRFFNLFSTSFITGVMRKWSTTISKMFNCAFSWWKLNTSGRPSVSPLNIKEHETWVCL